MDSGSVALIAIIVFVRCWLVFRRLRCFFRGGFQDRAAGPAEFRVVAVLR